MDAMAKAGSKEKLPGNLGAKAAANSEGRWSFELAAFGRPVSYVLIAGPAIYGFAWTDMTFPGSVLLAVVSIGVLGIRLGIDLAGSQNRRLERENKRHMAEIDRLCSERSALQQAQLKVPLSSHKGK